MRKFLAAKMHKRRKKTYRLMVGEIISILCLLRLFVAKVSAFRLPVFRFI
jgi:hypothetical protein